MQRFCHIVLRRVWATAILPAILSVLPLAVYGACPECDDCVPRVAVKTNLVHDVLLTPDLGIEVSIARRFSLSGEGVWAWWSRSARHRYWRIYGGWLEFRYWLGSLPGRRALSGHHVGVYGSMLEYDFEFGGKGWQSPGLTYGVGVSYGYSFPLNARLNIDVSARVGYSCGELIEYRPQCGTYVCQKHSYNRYFGPTGIEISLVWFPGGGKKNNPVYDL